VHTRYGWTRVSRSPFGMHERTDTYLVARADVPRIRIHDIRHTVVTMAIAAGSPIKAVSQHVGHSKTSITMDIYAHVLPDQRLEVATKISAAFFDEQAPNT